VLAPSCVPAVPGKEGAGAAFFAEEVADLLDRDGVIGIAEIMDYMGVYNNDPRMVGIIEEGLKRGMFLQGHSPSVHGDELNAYLCAGPVSCHEGRNRDEVIEKLRLGMHINVQASSISQDANIPLIQGLLTLPWNDNVSICTDDVHASDLLKTGHINHVVGVCCKVGMDPILAVRCASYNAAREYHFDDLGAIAPGYVADMQLVDSLEGVMPYAVYCEGKLVAKEGKLVAGEATEAVGTNVNTVNIPQIQSLDDLRIPAPIENGTVAAYVHNAAMNPFIPNQPLYYKELPVVNGYVDLSQADEPMSTIAIINRHGAGDKTIVPAINFMCDGALGSTISHDSHNMTLLYNDVESAMAVARELERVGGGMCVAYKGEVIATLPLPVAGLMSTLPCQEQAAAIDAFAEKLSTVCKDADGMLLRIAVMALPVAPGYVLTDRGVVNGASQEFIPQFK